MKKENLLITFHHKLMSSAYQINIVLVVEFLYYVATKEITCPSWTYTPACNFIRVAPHKIAHRTIMWYLLLPVDCSDLIQSANRGG